MLSIDVLGGLILYRAPVKRVCVCVAAGGGSDTEYESYDDDDDERPHRETAYVNDDEHWQPISDHEEIRLPQ